MFLDAKKLFICMMFLDWYGWGILFAMFLMNFELASPFVLRSAEQFADI